MGTRVWVVVSNSATGEGLAAAHGFAAVAEVGGRRLLFDAGPDPDVLERNCEALGIDLGKMDAVVLSHGYYDHSGGLRIVAERAHLIPLFHGPRAFEGRWVSRPDGSVKVISSPVSPEELAQQGMRFEEVSDVAHPMPGVTVFAHGPGPTLPLADRFSRGPSPGVTPDDFDDEIFALVETRRGSMLLAGCTHHPVASTLAAARRADPSRPVAVVLGGLHLAKAGPEEIARAYDALAEAGVSEAYVSHCTGQAFLEHARERCGAVQVREAHAGAVLDL